MKDQYPPQEQPLQPEQASDEIILSERAIGVYLKTLREAYAEQVELKDTQAADEIKLAALNAEAVRVSKRVMPDGTYKTKK